MAGGDYESLRGGFVLQLGCPENRGGDRETRVLQAVGNQFHAVSIAGERQVGAEGIFSVYWSTFCLKRQEQIATRHQDPGKLVEALGKPIRGCMNDRVPADSTSEHSRFDGKGIKLVFLELDLRLFGFERGLPARPNERLR